MSRVVDTIDINFFGVFQTTLHFNSLLNIISGENGTCKTNVLKSIKSGKSRDTENNPIPKESILAISPKRNSQRQTLKHVIEKFKRENKNYDSVTTNRIQAEMNDDTFSDYASLSELFYAFFDKKCRDGGNQIEKMEETKCEFNTVIKSVFDDYELKSTWDGKSGIPNIELLKNSNIIPLTGLSSGEQEVFSLILNLYVAAPRVDVILIDEPEIHLNWHLEEKLFDYFLAYSKQNNKQIIISTHSRVIFKEKFINCTQFFVWDNGRIVVKKEIPNYLKNRIAGDSIEIIKLGQFAKPTFFVEDTIHKKVLTKLFEIYLKDITITSLDNSGNVISFFKHSLSEGGWQNAFFLVDGDNQENPFPKFPNFIHLDEYCIENYLIRIEILSSIYSIKKNHIRKIILDAIKANKNSIFKKNKYFEFLIDKMSLKDINTNRLKLLDASQIFPYIVKELGDTVDNFIDKYLTYIKENNLVKTIFPHQICELIQ